MSVRETPRRSTSLRAARLLIFALVALVALVPGAVLAADRPGCAAPDGFTNPAAIKSTKRGVNLPDWDRIDAGSGTRSAALKQLARAGFSHVRLPVDDSKLHSYGGVRVDATAYLDALTGEIAELNAIGFAVSVDLHPGEALHLLYQSDPDAALRIAEDVWADLADVVGRFDPRRVYAELMNEPPTTAEIWTRQLPALAAFVRKLLPKHTLIVSPAGPQRHEALADLQPLADRNAIYAVHYYDPFAFTHQGANWMEKGSGIPALKGIPYPASATDPRMATIMQRLKARGDGRAAEVLRLSLIDSWEPAGIDAAFDVVADWSRRFDRPVIVNEFGVYRDFAPHRSRLAWLGDVAASAERHCLGWTHWDYDQGFGLIDPTTGLPDRSVVEALVPAAHDAGNRDASSRKGAPK